MSPFKKLSALVLVIGLTAAACGSDPEVTEDSTAAESDPETDEARDFEEGHSHDEDDEEGHSHDEDDKAMEDDEEG